jgi:hypothetical protein
VLARPVDAVEPVACRQGAAAQQWHNNSSAVAKQWLSYTCAWSYVRPLNFGSHAVL